MSSCCRITTHKSSTGPRVQHVLPGAFSQVDAGALAAPLGALLAAPTPFNGRYCAAAALANMAAAGPNARRAIVSAAALPPAVAMLSSGDDSAHSVH